LLTRLSEQASAQSAQIDKSLVQDLNTDSSNAAFVEAILIMSRHLGLPVIAEGVETPEQMEFLRDNNCKVYQGYLV
jgi:EAL domain-containing protein (putative c-di-GMP-specific phosphodiesterase class I)